MKASLRNRSHWYSDTDAATVHSQRRPGDWTWREAPGTRTMYWENAAWLWRQMLALIVICTCMFGLGFGAGKILHDPQATAMAHASGACIALEMAAAHGAVDEIERRMTLRALASALNPHFGRFPEQASEIASVCEKLSLRAMGVRNVR